MATKQDQAQVPLPARVCFDVLGAMVKAHDKWQLERADPGLLRLDWTIGAGWFSRNLVLVNAARMQAVVRAVDDRHSQVTIQAGSVGTAILDIDGYLDKALERVFAELEARVKVVIADWQQRAALAGQGGSARPAPAGLRVFLSYRRADSEDIVGRIYDRLVAALGPDRVFKDVDNIPPGVDFRQYLHAAVGACQLMFAVIGRQWAGPQGRGRRIDDPGDFVRIEIESALARGMTVVPLLVGGAAMPPADSLPPSLRHLAWTQAVTVRPDPDFHRDMDRLIAPLVNAGHS